MPVAVVHDYLTQRGGAERVVLSMLRTFPGAPVYTSLYAPDETFPGFRAFDVRPSPLNRIGVLRRSHRLALPLLAPVFSRMRVVADVAVCSSSGWAHGADVRGRKIVYCYAPARWLYQRERYTRGLNASRVSLALMRPALLRWDRRAAASADRYIVTSRAVRDAVRDAYGIDAEILAPPHGMDPMQPREPVAGLEEGFLLSVSRLLPYKNVDVVVEAMRLLPRERLVVVGDGPERARLREAAPANVRFAGTVSDAQLRWLYASCAGAVSASFEDFGLVPLEAASFGRPTAALRFGGFLDTIDDGRTGVLFDRPLPDDVAGAVVALRGATWDEDALHSHAARFSEEAFGARLREIVLGS